MFTFVSPKGHNFNNFETKYSVLKEAKISALKIAPNERPALEPRQN